MGDIIIVIRIEGICHGRAEVVSEGADLNILAYDSLKGEKKKKRGSEKKSKRRTQQKCYII